MNQLSPTQAKKHVVWVRISDHYLMLREAAEAENSSEQEDPRVLVILALVLERLVGRNEVLLVNGPKVSSHEALGHNIKVFDGVRAPSISIPKYLQRIYQYTRCSPSCFVVGYVYMDRLVHRHPHLLFLSINVHRLLLTSLMLASKMFDDEHYDNAFYARVGGVSNAELNRLELELLFMLDFNITLTAPEFEIYCYFLEREMPRSPALHAPSALVTPASLILDQHDQEEEEDFQVQLAPSPFLDS